VLSCQRGGKDYSEARLNKIRKMSFCGTKLLSPPIPPEIPTPAEYFKQMFDDNMVEGLVFQSNLYAMQKEGVQLKVTSKEMGQFLGIHMLMGIIKKSTISQHWDRATRFLFIADVISRDRLKTLQIFFSCKR